MKIVISFVPSSTKKGKEYRKHSCASRRIHYFDNQCQEKKKVVKNFGQPLLHQGNEDAEIVDSIIIK